MESEDNLGKNIEAFVLKVGTDGHVEVPRRLLDIIKLEEGDSVLVLLRNNKIVKIGFARSHSTTLFPPEVVPVLDRNQAQIDAGHFDEISDLHNLSKKRAPKARAANAKSA